MFRRTKVNAGVLAALGAMSMASMQAQAQQQTLERVEITGSSIRRVDAETALPVTVITKEEIARTGVTSTEALLQTISATSGQGGTSTSMGAGLSTYGAATISLRGLGEDRTLVLVNGRRLAAFAGGNGAAVNVNAIPLAAIERVEVLKDGASGVYGSDAIAGVVNFILTKNFQGIQLEGTVNHPTRSGGGGSQRASIVAGFGDGSQFNATLSATLEKEKALYARDRSFAKTGNVPPYLVAAATGQGNIQGTYTPGTRDTNGVWTEGSPGPGFGNPTRSYGNPLAAADNCAAVNMFNAGLTSKGAPYCSFDSNAFVGLVPDRKLSTLSGNLSFKINDQMELFGDALFSKSVVRQEYQPSPLRRDFMQSDLRFAAEGADPALLIYPTNPAYQTAATYLRANGFGSLVDSGLPLAVTARVFDFGNRANEDTSKQTRLVAGLRGTVGKTDYEIAAATNQNKVEGKTVTGYFSQFDFAKAVSSPTSDYNPWSLTQSQAFKDAIAGAAYVGPTLVAKTGSNTVDGKISGELMDLPAGPLQYATGAQYRNEKLKLEPSDALLSGDIAGLGGATRPVDKDRKITSVFGELNAPIVKSLEGNLALRSDRYNDVGSTTNYKASLRWQPNQQVLLRGSLGTGFRAPTLLDLHQPQTLGTSEQFNDPVTGEQDLQVNSLTGGNRDLKPEKSRQRSIGIVASPTRDVNVAVDFFNIAVTDMIALESAQAVVARNAAGDPAYADLVVRNDSGGIEQITQVLRNVGSAKLRGVDIEAAWRIPFEGSRLDLSLAGTYMTKFDVTRPSGSISHNVGTTVDESCNPIQSTNNASQDGVVPRWKHYLSATYASGPWAYTLAQNFYKGYRDGCDLDGNPHSVPGRSLYDAVIAYTGIKNLKLSLGVKNLFDSDPPLFIPTSNQFQAGYDVTMYDPRGRFIYATVSYKF